MGNGGWFAAVRLRRGAAGIDAALSLRDHRTDDRDGGAQHHQRDDADPLWSGDAAQPRDHLSERGGAGYGARHRDDRWHGAELRAAGGGGAARRVITGAPAACRGHRLRSRWHCRYGRLRLSGPTRREGRWLGRYHRALHPQGQDTPAADAAPCVAPLSPWRAAPPSSYPLHVLAGPAAFVVP